MPWHKQGDDQDRCARAALVDDLAAAGVLMRRGRRPEQRERCVQSFLWEGATESPGLGFEMAPLRGVGSGWVWCGDN